MVTILNRSKINNYFSGILAIFCSDERFTEANLTFLKSSLKIKQCDLMAIPGGCAFIVNNELNLLQRLKMLVDAHDIKQIILISHYDCGYYKRGIDNSSEEKISNKQLCDIQQSAHILKELFEVISVKGFYAQPDTSRIIKYTRLY